MPSSYTLVLRREAVDLFRSLRGSERQQMERFFDALQDEGKIPDRDSEQRRQQQKKDNHPGELVPNPEVNVHRPELNTRRLLKEAAICLCSFWLRMTRPLTERSSPSRGARPSRSTLRSISAVSPRRPRAQEVGPLFARSDATEDGRSSRRPAEYVLSVLLRVGTSRCDVPARVQRAERHARNQPSFRA